MTPHSQIFISEGDYDISCNQDCPSLIARRLMEGIFHENQLVNHSLTGQGYGVVPSVRPPIGRNIADIIASMLILPSIYGVILFL